MFRFTLGANKLPQIYCLRTTNMYSSTINNLGSISPEKNRKIHRQVFQPPGNLFLNDSLSIFMLSPIAHSAYYHLFPENTILSLPLPSYYIFVSQNFLCPAVQGLLLFY